MAAEHDVDPGCGVERGEKLAQHPGRVDRSVRPGREHRVMLEDEAERRGPPGHRDVPRRRFRAQGGGALVGVVDDHHGSRPLEPVGGLWGETGRPVSREGEQVEEGLALLDLVVVVPERGVERDGGKQRPVGREEARVVRGLAWRRLAHPGRRGLVDVPYDEHEVGGDGLRRDGAGDGVLLGAVLSGVSEHDEPEDVGSGGPERELGRPPDGGERAPCRVHPVRVVGAGQERRDHGLVPGGEPGRRGGFARRPLVHQPADPPLSGRVRVPDHGDPGLGVLEVGAARHRADGLAALPAAPGRGGRGIRRLVRRRRPATPGSQGHEEERRRPPQAPRSGHPRHPRAYLWARTSPSRTAMTLRTSLTAASNCAFVNGLRASASAADRIC